RPPISAILARLEDVLRIRRSARSGGALWRRALVSSGGDGAVSSHRARPWHEGRARQERALSRRAISRARDPVARWHRGPRLRAGSADVAQVAGEGSRLHPDALRVL